MTHGFGLQKIEILLHEWNSQIHSLSMNGKRIFFYMCINSKLMGSHKASMSHSLLYFKEVRKEGSE